LILFTVVSTEIRERLEQRCAALGLRAVSALDAVTDALEQLLGQEARGRPGRQHTMDEAYFRRVDAIQFTIAHDDGIGWENWEQADILLAGVSRSSKTPTSIYLANRGFRVANIPIVVESPPPSSLFSVRRPLVVGLTTSPERLIQVRRNRLLSLNQAPETSYVDGDHVTREVQFARRMFADNGWPVIDVSRRSIEETAAAVINLYNERHNVRAAGGGELANDTTADWKQGPGL
jgi:[pyruvate, water dikinase]-phosphate phosphotransferase / [pyruvate, water dikinase] kinase